MERVIRVSINTIENVKRENVTVRILIYHGGTLIDESGPLVIEPDFRDPPTAQRIDFLSELRCDVHDRANVEAIVSAPLIVQVIEHERDVAIGPASAAGGDGKKKDKKKSARKSSDLNNERKIIGLCNVDMIPIILGEKNVFERLVLEEPKQSGSTRSSWLNLPILTVSLSQDEPDFLPPEWRANYLMITVESIHNPPTSFTEGLEYTAATIIHTDEKVETVIFEGGEYSKYRDVELTKRWRSLSKMEGRGRLSKYKIDSHYKDMRNPLKSIDLKSIVEKDNPRIEWNYMSRHILFLPDQEAMKDKLEKYGYWPFQFKVSHTNSDPVNSKQSDSRTQMYQCYADVSELLYPGRTQARTVAQLYTLSTTEMMEKTGCDKTLFDEPIVVESKSKEKKGKIGTKGSSIILASTPSEPVPCIPLNTDFGEPVFVVVQFEVYEPFLPGHKIEEVECNLTELLGPPEKLSPYLYAGDIAEEQYIRCIRGLARIIVENYRDFDEENKKAKISSTNASEICEDSGKKYFYIPDEIDRFTQYLYDNGIYGSVRATLKKKVGRLLDQKFKMQSCTWDSIESQNFVANVYAYLVEQMHIALNSEDGNCVENENAKTDNSYYFAEEHYELENISQAKQIYIDLIARKRNDPESWLAYAIFSKKVGDDDKSLQCCREAATLNSRHKLALLFYGVLLAETENYSGAEIFLRATTHLYPRFFEAWGTLHLLFLRTEFFSGVDLTFRAVEDCLLDHNRDRVRTYCLENEPLAWTTILCPKNRIYLILAIFLLKLNLFDFAGIALAQELSLMGRSTPWLYYMAVHHYLLTRYEDALTHLEEAQLNYGMDYSISALMGHCHFKKGNLPLAMECYEFASTLFNRPTDIHLVHLRMGNYFTEIGDYNRGRKVLLDVCKTSPTASSWFGLGVVFYETADFKDAEVVLTEANRLDPTNPQIWAYLCLLNITLQRYDEFVECYRQTVKNDLQNPTLWLRIENAMQSSGLSSPMLPTTEWPGVVKQSSESITSELK